MRNIVRELIDELTKTKGEKCGEEMEEALEYLEDNYPNLYFDYSKKEHGAYGITISDSKEAAEGNFEGDNYMLFIIQLMHSGEVKIEYWKDGLPINLETDDEEIIDVEVFESEDLISAVESRI
jgi:hypothetical protein